MLKIIKKKEYEELLSYKEKYEEIIGQRWVFIFGGRSITSRLMQLSKEMLVHIIMELRNDIKKLNKKLKRQAKCRLEKVEE